MEPKVIEQSPISMTNLKIEIEKIKKRNKEPSIRVTKVEDYLNAMMPLTAAKEKQLIAAIKKLNIPRIKDDHIVKIADTLPKTIDDLKLVMQGYVISISNENMKKIVEVLKGIVSATSEKSEKK